MQDLIEKLKELIGQCEARIRKCDQDDATNSATRATLEAQKKEQETTARNQAQENERIKKLKLVTKVLAEAEEIKRQASLDLENLNSRKEHFEIEKKGFKNDIRVKEQELQAAWKKLEKKGKTLEKDILAAIAKEEKWEL